MAGNVMLAKLNYTEEQYVFHRRIIYTVLHTFSTICVHIISYFASNCGNKIWNAYWLQALTVSIHSLG
jgi:hypothetical protein